MASKGPKTPKGKLRKMLTGDGRKSTFPEKFVKEDRDRAANVKEMLFGKKKKTTKKKKK